MGQSAQLTAAAASTASPPGCKPDSRAYADTQLAQMPMASMSNAGAEPEAMLPSEATTITAAPTDTTVMHTASATEPDHADVTGTRVPTTHEAAYADTSLAWAPTVRASDPADDTLALDRWITPAEAMIAPTRTFNTAAPLHDAQRWA